jgi:hypothetical protein
VTTDPTSTITSPTPPHARDDDRGVVAVAWPTGRPIYAYTPQDIAEGVDVYTRLLKARRAQGGEPDA